MLYMPKNKVYPVKDTPFVFERLFLLKLHHFSFYRGGICEAGNHRSTFIHVVNIVPVFYELVALTFFFYATNKKNESALLPYDLSCMTNNIHPKNPSILQFVYSYLFVFRRSNNNEPCAAQIIK
jgi:hypothetical protein